MNDEIWKPVVGFEGLYEVSDMGNVRSFSDKKRGRLLKPNLSKGYLKVGLCVSGMNKTKWIHRLVAHAFIGEQPEGLQINHKDGVKTNNRADNLEYVTPQRNTQHAVDTGLLLPQKGTAHGMAKLTDEQIEEIRAKYIPRVYSQYRLAKEYGVCVMQINRIIHRKRWSHI